MDTKDLYMKYAMMYRKRHTKRDKIRFLTILEDEFKQMNFRTSIRKTSHQGKESYSLYVNDLKNAKKIIATHYDTPVETFIKLDYVPFDLNNHKRRNLIGITLPSLVIFGLGLLISIYFMQNHWAKSLFSIMSFIGYFIILALFVLLRNVRFGIRQVNNDLSNTSSIVEIIKYAKDHPHVAYVFTDYGTEDQFGYLCLRDYLEDSYYNKIYFVDSIGNNPENLLVLDEIAHSNLKDHFKNITYISSGKLINNRVILDKDAGIEVEESLLKKLNI